MGCFRSNFLALISSFSFSPRPSVRPSPAVVSLNLEIARIPRSHYSNYWVTEEMRCVGCTLILMFRGFDQLQC